MFAGLAGLSRARGGGASRMRRAPFNHDAAMHRVTWWLTNSLTFTVESTAAPLARRAALPALDSEEIIRNGSWIVDT
jgi:hypothetical protein